MHENFNDLTELSKYFEECLNILMGKGINIRIIDAQPEQEVVVNSMIINIDDIINGCLSRQ